MKRTILNDLNDIKISLDDKFVDEVLGIIGSYMVLVSKLNPYNSLIVRDLVMTYVLKNFNDKSKTGLDVFNYVKSSYDKTMSKLSDIYLDESDDCGETGCNKISIIDLKIELDEMEPRQLLSFYLSLKCNSTVKDYKYSRLMKPNIIYNLNDLFSILSIENLLLLDYLGFEKFLEYEKELVLLNPSKTIKLSRSDKANINRIKSRLLDKVAENIDNLSIEAIDKLLF